MHSSLLTRYVDNWALTFRFIKEVTGLNLIALELPARLIDDELNEDDDNLLYICETHIENDDRPVSLMKSVWERLKYNPNSDKKSLACNMHTSKFEKIGEIQFNNNYDGCGEVTIILKREMYF